MVWTTPESKASKHKKRHEFIRGGCGYCGWYCIDCSDDVVTCKCTYKSVDKRLADEATQSIHAP